MSPPPSDTPRGGRRSGLAAQLARRFSGQLTDGLYPPGARFPSIRALAALHGCAGNTVASALEQLVALGWLEPRPGAGFFVRDRSQGAAQNAPATDLEPIDPQWLLRQQYGDGGGAAAGLPPPAWLHTPAIERVIRRQARIGDVPLGYGDPAGFGPLRERLCERLAGLRIGCQPGQVVTLGGANAAIDTVVRTLVKPGDPVLVEEPGYYPLFGKLSLAGGVTWPVPRLADGPDLEALEALAAARGPCLFFVQPHGHNPTGGHLSDAKAQPIVALAQRHGLTLVELDPLAHLAPRGAARLSALDGWARSVYIGTFSKLLPSGLRSGFVVAAPALAARITAVKALVGINTSEFTERLVAETLAGTALRGHGEGLRRRIGAASNEATRVLHDLGAEVLCPDAGSLYAWARFAQWPDALALAQVARAAGLTLAPGAIFNVAGQASPWLRFNVGAVAGNGAFAGTMARLLGVAPPRPAA